MADPRALLPLPAHDFQVLLALAEQPRHAYGLATAVESAGAVRLELGSLYRILARLTTLGVIADDGPGAGSPQEARRRYYRITPFGRSVAAAETARLEAVVRLARRQLAAGRSRP